jgi:uncharacterized protein involved in type VI secretion and phage assembly
VDVPVGDATIVDFLEGLPNQPYVVGSIYAQDGSSLTVTPQGSLSDCSSCP